MLLRYPPTPHTHTLTPPLTVMEFGEPVVVIPIVDVFRLQYGSQHTGHIAATQETTTRPHPTPTSTPS